MALKIDAKFEGNWLVLSNFDRLKISDFILDSKMVELNQNKNLKQLGRPDAMSKLYFSLEIKE